MTEDIFHKILNNAASNDEKKEFYLSLEKDAEARETFLRLKNIHALSKINRRQYEGIKQKSFNRFWSLVNPEKKNRAISLWMRYAAIFIVAISIGFFARYILPGEKQAPILSQHIEYRSDKGSVSTIILDDGSMIWLSTASQISIDKNPDGKIIAKLNGEAYFDLVPDTTRDFVVDLDYFKVKDIGTKFNIRAYTEEQTIFTSLVHGKIDLINSNQRSLLSMQPGEYAAYNKESNSITVSAIDPSLVTAWKDGKFVFIDKTLQDICNELENWYNVEIVIENQALAGTRYTSVVKRSTTVYHVLRMLAITDNVKYEIKDRKEGKDLIYIR